MGARSSRTRAWWLAILCLAIAPRLQAQGPDLFAYQIRFPLPPTSGATALDSLEARRAIVISAMACGSELAFAHTFGVGGEDAAAFLIAKLVWVGGHTYRQHFTPPGATTCRFSRNVNACDVFLAMHPDATDCENSAFNAFVGAEWKDLRAGNLTPLDQSLRKRVPPCAVPIVDSVSAWADTNVVRLSFVVDAYCMAAQVNASLVGMTVVGQMGTKGSACKVFGKSDGDWDMTGKNLIRLAYLDEQYGILDEPAKKNMQEQLLIADGGPAEEHYALDGCGNTEHSTGSSQDRADERDWTDSGGFWDSLGDFGLFLLKLLAVVFIVYALIYAAVAYAAGVVAAILLPIIVAGAVAVVFPVIPETENHLLMINTCKYLKNQFIIRDVGPGSSAAAPFEQDQRDLRDWLLAKLHKTMEGDLIEYNSRPYNRLTISALMNLVDFAADSDVARGAHLVTDYSFAKFAIGSKDGRHFVPYRRTREAMRKYIDDPASPNGNFDLLNAGDQQVGLGLFYAGQTQQLPFGLVSTAAPLHALFAATSPHYAPDPFIVDLVIDKTEPVYQRIAHQTVEMFSSGAGYLISAGGMETGIAYPVLGDALDIALKPDRADDKGVALPTTLMLGIDPTDTLLTPRPVRTSLGELIRIDGVRNYDDMDHPSYGGNQCVWVGFACGINIVVPPLQPDPGTGFDSQTTLPGAAGPCMSKGPPGAASEWSFIDTKRCAAYRNAPRVYIALYRQACPSGSDRCADNFGFFEVVDATPYGATFDSFKQQVVTANKPGFVGHFHGTYHSFRGQDIEFSTPDGSSEFSVVDKVNGVTQPLHGSFIMASGSPQLPAGVVTPMMSDGQGLITVRNNHLKRWVELDFRDATHPKRVVH